MKIKPYYPTKSLGCNPIHEVKDWCYVRKLIRAARKGVNIALILIDGEVGNCQLLAGTHRAAANDLMMMLGGEPLIDAVNINTIDTSEALKDAIMDSDYRRIDEIWDQ